MSYATPITDSFLQSVLDVNTASQNQCLKLLDQLIANNDTDDLERSGGLSKEQKALNVYTGRLRGLNRKTVHRTRDIRAETAEARAGVDTLHLQLQNLYYEQRHLRGEISACESYE